MKEPTDSTSKPSNNLHGGKQFFKKRKAEEVSRE